MTGYTTARAGTTSRRNLERGAKTPTRRREADGFDTPLRVDPSLQRHLVLGRDSKVQILGESMVARIRKVGPHRQAPDERPLSVGCTNKEKAGPKLTPKARFTYFRKN
jgi:hypothetical protein